jgi:hypothetical protein
LPFPCSHDQREAEEIRRKRPEQIQKGRIMIAGSTNLGDRCTLYGILILLLR